MIFLLDSLQGIEFENVFDLVEKRSNQVILFSFSQHFKNGRSIFSRKNIWKSWLFAYCWRRRFDGYAKEIGGQQEEYLNYIIIFSFERTVMFLFWIFHSGTRIEVRQLWSIHTYPADMYTTTRQVCMPPFLSFPIWWLDCLKEKVSFIFSPFYKIYVILI
jgi:hypothetical protein